MPVLVEFEETIDGGVFSAIVTITDNHDDAEKLALEAAEETMGGDYKLHATTTLEACGGCGGYRSKDHKKGLGTVFNADVVI